MEQRICDEALRLSIQASLDSKKTALERNKLGQFATPSMLAKEMLLYGLSLMQEDQHVRFLDPAIGTGSFYSALCTTIADRLLDVSKGYELDPHYGLPAQEFWADYNMDIEIADFTRAKPPVDGFNLLICNPPYVRHHHLNGDEKQRLQIESQNVSGMKLSGLAGLYCYFMLLAHRWMSVDGVAGWLVPSEFMDVNYGRELKRYLLEKVTLLRIHRFDPSEAQFDDALVSSAVVWFKKTRPSVNHTVEFSYGGSHASPNLSRHISSLELASELKWTRFPRQDVRVFKADSPTLSDIFNIKRGIATGGNEFFILNREKIEELDLPMKFFKPILPSARHIKVDEIEADNHGNPILSQSLFLLDCNLLEHEIKEFYPSLWHYLESGKETIAARYLCKARSIWYKQEQRLPSPFICTYMGRSDSASGKPFRFLLNHSRAIVANTYLILYPKPHIAERLHCRPDLIRGVWNALNDILPEMLTSEGRVYGGGLHKMEPRELAKVSSKEISMLLGL